MQTALLTKSTPDQSDLFSLDDTGDVYFSQIFFSSWILKSLESFQNI